MLLVFMDLLGMLTPVTPPSPPSPTPGSGGGGSYMDDFDGQERIKKIIEEEDDWLIPVSWFFINENSNN